VAAKAVGVERHNNRAVDKVLKSSQNLVSLLITDRQRSESSEAL
jgi:hypothetical protein